MLVIAPILTSCVSLSGKKKKKKTVSNSRFIIFKKIKHDPDKVISEYLWGIARAF